MASREASHRRYQRRSLLGMAALALSAPAIAMPVRMRLGGTGVALGGLEQLRAVLQSRLDIESDIVTGLGTQGGISAAAAGRVDVAISARPLSPAERDQGLAQRVWGSTPLVFATRADSAVQALTSQQAVGMIGGDITKWEDGHRVRVTRRPAQDSDTRLLAGLSEPMARAVAAMQSRPGVLTAVTDRDMADALERAAGSFGVVGLGLIRSENRSIKPLTLDGRTPTDEAWPMHKPLVLVFKAQPDQWLGALIEALFSQPAIGILRPLGYNIREGA